MRPTAKANEPERKITMFTSNASVKSASNNTISTPKFFRFNLFNDTIEGSEFNFKKAGDPTSAQYAELMQFKAIQPSFKFAPIASAKKVEKKQTYKGLDMGLMADYIRVFGNEQVKAEFNHMVEDKKITYPTIKSWFLDEFKHFNVNQAKAQIAKSELTSRKAAVRTAVKVKTAKVASNVVEMPTAQNF